MTNFEKITIAANQLANDGKKPTVALIKAKMSDPVSLPQIVSTLKSWHHEPGNCTLFTHQIPESNNEKKENEIKGIMITQEQLDQSVNKAVEQVFEKTITPLKKELAEIKALLTNMNKKVQ